MTSMQTLVFYATPEHTCSYLDNRLATTLFVDPKATIDQTLYTRLTHLGFRRSGSHYYRPRCNGCNACLSVRVNVQDFQPSRSQSRCLKANRDLIQATLPVDYSNEHYHLYRRYIESRHQDGDMYPPSLEQYENFLLNAPPDSRLLEYRHPDGELLGVSVTDALEDGLSAIYTFFHPGFAKRSLGVFAVLKQIEMSRQQGLKYLYLGYWIRNCQKMSYKTQYRPLEILLRDQWIPVP